MTLQELRSLRDEELIRVVKARLALQVCSREPHQEALDGLEPLGERLSRIVRLCGIGTAAVACAFILWWLGGVG